MTKAIIPYQSPDIDLPTTNNYFHSKSVAANRSAVLSELRCISGVPEIASTLSHETVYKLVSTPEGGRLFKDSVGNFKGVFYKDGKIIEHAKFQTVSPSLVKAATTVGSQILLLSIAMQLNRIEQGISRILNEFHNDRISEISSGVKQFEQAMMVQDIDRQSRMIEHAIQTLNTGIEKTVRSLKMQIEDAPNIKIGLWDNWFTNKATVAKEKFALAEESFKACLLGIKTLSECYASINEANAASATLINNLSNLKSSGIETAAQKARLIPAKANKFREEPWLSFLKNEPLLIDEINKCRSLANNEFECIEIEFKPMEIMEK
ncbi:MAG: hypothetical protein GX556_04035 [Fibrobacter sp.]|nr:hypothetical protein [Fibrobacter sp.]